jgi:sec-independent protein translocase protein TatA
MFGLQPTHVIIILAIALLIFGPMRLPELGRALGKMIKEFRSAGDELAESAKDKSSKRVVDDDKEQPNAG